jgi:ankyrin repeat protein
MFLSGNRFLTRRENRIIQKIGRECHSPLGGSLMDLESEFFESIKSGDLVRIKALIEATPALIHTRSEQGVSAIMLAAYHSHPDLVLFLLSRKPALDLFEAAATGQAEQVVSLIERTPSLVSATSPDGFYPLHLAAFLGYPEIVSCLVAQGAEVNAVSANPMRVRPLHSALANRQAAVILKIAQVLLAHGAEVNVVQAGGWTPLHQAAVHGLVDLVKLLLANGADPKAKAENGKSPIDLAAESGKNEVLSLFRQESK